MVQFSCTEQELFVQKGQKIFRQEILKLVLPKMENSSSICQVYILFISKLSTLHSSNVYMCILAG